MKRVGVTFALAIVLAGTMSTAFAYAVPTGTGEATGTSLREAPTGTFTIDWNSFLNGLPVESFIQSLQSVGQNVAGSSVKTIVPQAVSSDTAKNMLSPMDDWTSSHLGFRFSSLMNTVLGILSWTLGIAKTIVDWLINFLK